MFIKSCWSILNQLQTLPGDRRLELSCRGMWPAAAGISRLIIIAIKISSCVQMLSVPVRKCSGSLEKFCKKSGEKPREKDQFGDSVEQTGARHPAMCCCCSCRTTLELEMDLCEVFTIKEPAPTRAFSGLEAPTSTAKIPLGLLCDFKTSYFAKVRLKLYTTPGTINKTILMSIFTDTRHHPPHYLSVSKTRSPWCRGFLHNSSSSAPSPSPG